MKAPRKKYLLATAALCGLAVGIWVFYGKKSGVALVPQVVSKPAGSVTGKASSIDRVPIVAPIATTSTQPGPRPTIWKIDPNDPIHRTSFTLVTGRFLRMLARATATKDLPTERLAELAGRLAVARLSQSMFEATIATVTSRGKDVEIRIPAYYDEGENLKSELFDQLLKDVDDDGLRQQVTAQFGYFGQSAQLIKITTETETVDGQQVYRIDHLYNSVDSVGPIEGVSRLTAPQLGPYTAFVSLLPTP